MLSLAVPGDSWLHRMPAGAKLAVLCLATLILLPIAEWRIALAASLAMAGLFLSVSPRFARMGAKRLKPLAYMLALLLVYHMVTARMLEGIGVCLKILALVGLANLVTMTSRLDDMMSVVEWLLAPLRRFGLPPRLFSFAMGLVIRFTPVFLQKGRLLSDAWKARSPKRPSYRLVMPLALGAIDDADRVADAIKARGGLGTQNEGGLEGQP